ncbi:MAG: hypothetical protein HY532_07330 [Chloroflexi bacterium]|nr:hypothetical protein [Chloroflexota bacterium]
MNAKLGARSGAGDAGDQGPRRGWAAPKRLRSVLMQRSRLADALVVAILAVAGLLVARSILRDGFPPGVDTPTFLHLSWFTRETLRGAGGLIDPYWYGGFPAFTSYPPLSYALVGGMAAVPGVGLVFSYKVVLLAAYIGTGVATYYLARELGSSRPWSALGGMLTVLGYPTLVAVGLWGWFSSVVALPLALAALAMLERAYHRGETRFAIGGGVALGLSVLAHHMTAFAFALGLPAWVLFHYLRGPVLRPRLYKTTLLFAAAAAAATVWWIVPWLVNMLQVGFRRETPGLWSFPLSQYLESIAQTKLIGLYAYPTYMGIALIGMAVGGILQAIVAPSRYTPYAILLVLLMAFSLGEQVNPLLRVRPFDGLDVARFQLYVVPVICVVGVPFLANAGRSAVDLLRLQAAPAWLPAAASGLLVALILGQALWDAGAASQRLFQPYRLTPATQQAIAWLGQEGHQGKVLGVGFWHWDDFLLPYYLRQAVVDGWHDEGGRNWRAVRPLRMMMWTGEIDVLRAHRLLGELGGRYIAVQDYFAGESPKEFRAALRQYPALFSEAADWGEVTIFERISPG